MTDPNVNPPPPPFRVTEDERFLQSTVDRLEEKGVFEVGKNSWRVFRIMGEFVEGFDELQTLGPAVGCAEVLQDA